MHTRLKPAAWRRSSSCSRRTPRHSMVQLDTCSQRSRLPEPHTASSQEPSSRISVHRRDLQYSLVRARSSHPRTLSRLSACSRRQKTRSYKMKSTQIRAMKARVRGVLPCNRHNTSILLDIRRLDAGKFVVWQGVPYQTVDDSKGPIKFVANKTYQPS